MCLSSPPLSRSDPPAVTSHWSHLREACPTLERVAQACRTLRDPTDYTAHGILQARILEWGAFPFSRGSSQPRIKPRSPALQADSLPAEPPGKPKNTGVGSLSLLQGDLSDPGIELGSPALKVDSSPAELSGKPGLRDAQITGKTLFLEVSGKDEHLHQ